MNRTPGGGDQTDHRLRPLHLKLVGAAGYVPSPPARLRRPLLPGVMAEQECAAPTSRNSAVHVPFVRAVRVEDVRWKRLHPPPVVDHAAGQDAPRPPCSSAERCRCAVYCSMIVSVRVVIVPLCLPACTAALAPFWAVRTRFHCAPPPA
ncbi:MAG: hypothetical protein WKH64_09540 [Chloroflexia bacterium]